jgi:hypothetical protein
MLAQPCSGARSRELAQDLHQSGRPSIDATKRGMEWKDVGAYSDTTLQQKQQLIKEAFLWSWESYRK